MPPPKQSQKRAFGGVFENFGINEMDEERQLISGGREREKQENLFKSSGNRLSEEPFLINSEVLDKKIRNKFADSRNFPQLNIEKGAVAMINVVTIQYLKDFMEQLSVASYYESNEGLSLFKKAKEGEV